MMSSPEGYRVKSLKFLIVGGINTALGYALYVALIRAGLHYNLALILAYIVGILTGYLMNRHLTFASHVRTHHSFLKYWATYIGVYVLNLILLNLIVGLKLLDPMFGQLLALGAVTLMSFLLQNFWVFRHEPVAMKNSATLGHG
jgi:putative flippase GtrA